MANAKLAAGPCSQEELLALYVEGADADVRRLQELLGEARAEPSSWADCSERMRGIVHNVKGQGASFGYPLMTRVGESLSILLKRTEGREAAAAELIEAHVKTLRAVLDNEITGNGGELGETLAGRLEGLVAKSG